MPTLKLGYDKINGIPFHEAIKAAQQRDVVLPDVYYGDLQGLARQLAFSIAGIAALDQLENVKNSLSAALQRGESQQKWTKEILESGVLDLPDYRLDNIFRTNIQNSYNRGRWERFQRTKATRPYLMYDAINDSRVRPNHLAMDGVIRPVDDQIWDTWSPACGYRCRCRLISLSEKQALARSGQGKGINKPIPGDVQPDKGWDYNPGADLTVGVKRALDSRENDVLMAVLSQKIDDFENNDQPKTIDDFIKYGADITKTMSDGASNPLLLHQQIIDRLRNEIGTDSPCITSSTGEGARLAKLASQIFPDSWTKKTDGLGNFYTKAKATTRGHCTTFGDEYDAFVGRRVKLHDFGIVEIEKGAGYMMVRKGDIGNAVHEYTHRMQAAMPELDQLFQDMHNRRTKNDPLEKLKDIYPGSGYKITEVTRKDKYINAYQGKEYDGEPLEVMTMAMEYILGVTEGHWLSNNRQENFKRFYEQDRELFDFTVGVLFGWAPS